MATGYTTRKLQVFSLHAHQDRIALENYKDLFLNLHKMSPEERILDVNDKIVAMPVLEMHESYVYFIVYEGEKDLHPIIYDAEKAKARIQSLVSGEVVATKTHGLIDFIRREGIIEYNFRGAKAKDIADVIQSSLSSISNYSKLIVQLNPVADGTFAAAIEKFERIRLGSLKVSKPNPGWTDHYDHLSKMAGESDGQTIKVEITAARGVSLSTSKGIIHYIKEFAQHSLSTFRSAKVSGVRPGETSETTISLENHIEHIKVSLKKTKAGHVEEQDIKKKIQEFQNSRSRRKNNA